jgi:glutamate synthase (NADPH) small chain
MDQVALQELESRCIQEEAPWCTAACPLHLDGRTFTGHIARGRWEDAWKVLHRYMPLPRILGRICDAPCERRCKRSEAGGAIRIGALERACVKCEPPSTRIVPLPAKGKSAVVAGGGLSGLTVAWDLARKGYAVSVFDSEDLPGASVLRSAPADLPDSAIDAEISVLKRIGVGFERSKNLDSKDFENRCRNSFDAVFLDLNIVSAKGWELERNDDGTIRIDTKNGSTSCDRIFAGAQTPSPVWQAARGRWAATSMDRFFQAVSISAGRDKEGPFETRLLTSLADVKPLPAVSAVDETKGYSQAEAQAEAQRCIQCECLECVKVCNYMERFGAYPKKYAREVYNNLSIVMGEHKGNQLINSCSLCGLCQQVCPNNFPMQDLCLQARRTMVDNGKMPPSAHDFALLDMAFSQSKQFALTRHEPGYDSSENLFFPGCQLCASAPQQVEQVYAHLRSTLKGGVGMMLNCCAAPAYWAGRRAAFENQLAHIKSQWEAMGKPRMILACSTCIRVFKEHLPIIAKKALWQVLETNTMPVVNLDTSRVLAVHDPCTTRFEKQMQSSVRGLMEQCGQKIEELPLGGENTECCGFGGLMQNANPELAAEVVRTRAQRSPSDYITYCAMCRDNLAAAGKRVIHLLDLFFPDPQQPDPALRPRPDWSRRQENRARLKARLLENVWNEAPQNKNARETIKLKISPDVAERLDRRRILTDDLKQVIVHAEAGGEKFYHSSSDRYKAAHTIYKVTFWVEYTPTSEGYLIHNAYAHRMEVIGP